MTALQRFTGILLWGVTILFAEGTESCLLADDPTARADRPVSEDVPPQHRRSFRFSMHWDELPPLPNDLGVAGPFVGVHNNALIVAGGANFPRPVWESNKQWDDAIHVLVPHGPDFEWRSGGTLPRPIGYGAAVSTESGVVCIGGNDAERNEANVFLLQWTGESIETVPLPSLPEPLAYSQAAVIGSTVYVVGGQTDLGLDSATNALWMLDLSRRESPSDFQWTAGLPLPGTGRAFVQVAVQHNGAEECLYVIGGRRMGTSAPEFLKDVWEYSPGNRRWRSRSDAPRPMAAGTAMGTGQGTITVIGSDDGTLFDKADELKDRHPGFPRRAYVYDTQADRWYDAGSPPITQVTTIPVVWNDRIIVATGEVRPRVRTPKVFRIRTEISITPGN